MTNSKNQVELWGVPESSPVLSHENHGQTFYQFPLLVPRLSGQTDRLPVLLPMSLRDQVQADAPLRLSGQLRSFNNKSGQGNRLVITVFAQSISPGDEETRNEIQLTGVICKAPVLRRTPLGRNICDIMLAVGRHYGRADYLPVITWGQLALRAGAMQVGDPLALEGRGQSRNHTKLIDGGPPERKAYEGSVMHPLYPEEEEPFEP